MNIFLWILQVALALHTLMGAIWKFKHTPAQTKPSLKPIPKGVWLALAVLEILCAVGLVLPAVYKPASNVPSLAAIIIAVEMLFFCALELYSRNKKYDGIIYWGVVALVCVFVAYGRCVLLPL